MRKLRFAAAVACFAALAVACTLDRPTGSPAGSVPAVAPSRSSNAAEATSTPFIPTPTPAASCPAMAAQPPAPIAVATLGPNGSLPPSPASAEGERFVLQGVLLSRTCEVRANTTFSVWHTDARGHYGPNDASGELICCWYQAELSTDADGRFELHTVRAASDPDPNGELPAHIHLFLEPANDDSPGIELVFADDPSHGPLGPHTIAIPMERRTDSSGTYWYSFVVIRI
jgi:intradiol ring-cleaving dioxygenase-like protein